MSEEIKDIAQSHEYSVDAFGEKFSYTFDGDVLQVASAKTAIEMRLDLRKGQAKLARKRVFHPNWQFAAAAIVGVPFVVLWMGLDVYMWITLAIMTVILGYHLIQGGMPRWAWRVTMGTDVAFNVFDDPNDPERTERFIECIRKRLSVGQSE